MTDKECMQKALELAKASFADGEVPVGAVITLDNEIIACGRNRRELGKNALYHAEIEAINNACKALHGWRLWQCTMYVTLEPCVMCAGAIVNARIPRVVFGAKDKKSGACGSVVNILELNNSYKPEYVSGVLENECKLLLTDFFRKLREKQTH